MAPDLARLDARLAALRAELDAARHARARLEPDAPTETDVASAHPSFATAAFLRRLEERLDEAEATPRGRGARLARVAGLARSLACAPDVDEALGLPARPVALPARTVRAADVAAEVARGEVRPGAALRALADALGPASTASHEALASLRERLGRRVEWLAHDPDRPSLEPVALAESVFAATDDVTPDILRALVSDGSPEDPWALLRALAGTHHGALVRGRDRPARLTALLRPLGLSGPLERDARIVGAAPQTLFGARAHVSLAAPRAPRLLLPPDVVERAPTGSLDAELVTACAVGFAIAPSLAVRPADPGLELPRQNVVGRVLGTFVARLRLDPRVLAREDAPGVALERLRRAGTAALLLGLRLDAAAVASGPAASRVARAARIELPEPLAARLLVRRHPAAALEGTVRGLALARGLREAHDEDFGRSHRAAEALRAALLGHLEAGPAETFAATSTDPAGDAARELVGLFDARF